MDAVDRTLRDRLSLAAEEIAARPSRDARAVDAAPRRTLRPLLAAAALAGVIAGAGTAVGLHHRLDARHVVPAGSPSGVPSPAAPTSRPTPTWAASPFGSNTTAVWDSTGGRVVVYGPADGKAGELVGHLWTWDGSAWWEQKVGAGGGPSDSGVLVDLPPLHGVALLNEDVQTFGTQIAFGSWVWNSAGWRRLPAAGFGTCLAPTAAAWDARHGYAMVVVANQCSGGSSEPASEAWTFDGTKWRRRGLLPAGVTYPMVVWDGGAQTVDLLDSPRNKTARAWSWSGSAWAVDGSPSAQPFGASLTGAAWDAGLGAVVAYAAPTWDGSSPARVVAFRRGRWSDLPVAAYPEYVDAVFADTTHGRLLAIGMEPVSVTATPGGFSAGPYYVLGWTGTSWAHIGEMATPAP